MVLAGAALVYQWELSLQKSLYKEQNTLWQRVAEGDILCKCGVAAVEGTRQGFPKDTGKKLKSIASTTAAKEAAATALPAAVKSPASHPTYADKPDKPVAGKTPVAAGKKQQPTKKASWRKLPEGHAFFSWQENQSKVFCRKIAAYWL